MTDRWRRFRSSTYLRIPPSDPSVLMAQRPAVRVDGLNDLRADLAKMDRAAPRELNKAQRRAMEPVRERAQSLAPHRSGVLAASIRPFTTKRGAGLRSPLPYANVQHWGGGRPTARNPKGIRGNRFIYTAIEERLDSFASEMGDAVEDLARRYGFR